MKATRLQQGYFEATVAQGYKATAPYMYKGRSSLTEQQHAPQTNLASWRGVIVVGQTGPPRKIKGIFFEADLSKAFRHSC
jgi:hypothetical protein